MNYPTIVDGIDFKELVFITNNDPVTDSFMVAKAFRKRHDNVVRDVERTIAACPEEFDTKLNFEDCYKNNELQNGKPQKFYRLRKDGLHKPMARLNVEVIPPDSETMNGIFAEIERKYAHQPMTQKVIDEMQREAARLVRRATNTKVTFVRD